eukprot:TRINITY_DN14817_c0_g1_i1.p4 TRINITY_DN14817_c0_g1~~TRINITY_DN14817_c0_g1_i1.p4  ORF type:complete len:100 (-),score=16.57 TRINITY_DN14817_c0_g1_i1:380-679(-)
MYFFFFLMIRRPPRSTQGVSSAASDVYKRQYQRRVHGTQSQVVRLYLQSHLCNRSNSKSNPTIANCKSVPTETIQYAKIEAEVVERRKKEASSEVLEYI